MNKKILFLPLYNDDWASSKYRVYKHIRYLENHGLKCTVVRPPEPSLIPRIRYYYNLFFNCFINDVIVIQKKIFRMPLFRLILMTKRKIIFDFDDAIYCYEKDINSINFILSKVNHVLVADESLAVYARNYNSNVTVMPTPLEAGHFARNQRKANDVVKVAWIGRPWNQHYLSGLEGVFHELRCIKSKIALYVVSGKPFQFKNTDFPVINIPWSEEAEERILHSIDIGIVPLTDDEWSRGKCGYKVLLYMSHGLPVIASPVGVKATLIKNGINGFLASSEEEWINKLCLLSEDQALRCKFGAAGYETFFSNFTYNALSARLADILQST